MENVQTKEKKKLNLGDYAPVVGFLCLETLALCGFYLGHSFLLYAIISIVLAILLVLVTFRQIKKDGISTFLFFLFPLFVFGLLTALSSFNTSSIGAMGLVNSIFLPIGLTLFALAGFLSSYIKTLNIKNVLIVIYASLAVFVLINLLITMFYYVPFYTIKYSNSYIVYDGKPSVVPIGSMAYMLFGFQAKEVSLEYWTLFPALLFTSVIQLFFVKYKENKTEFLIYLAITVLAAICLIFTISKKTLFQDIILIIGLAIIIVAAKLKKSRRVLDGMMIAFGVLFVLFILILFIISQTSWGFTAGLRNFISNHALLRRLFIANRYSNPVSVIFQDLLTTFKLFGCPIGGYAYQYPNGVAQIICNIWLFDNLMSSGLFGAIFFVVALVIAIRRLFLYIGRSEDEERIKFQITGFVLGYLVISLVLYDYTPLVNSNKMYPFYISAPLLICLYLLGYAFNKSLDKKVEEVVEMKEEEKQDEVIEI